MPIQVERTEFDPQVGYEYYVCFNCNSTMEEEEVHSRVNVQVAASLTETGDLADVTFEIPKHLRNDKALEFIRPQETASFVDPRLYVVFPRVSGDAVVLATGRLEVDVAGRIIGMEIQWSPEVPND